MAVAGMFLTAYMVFLLGTNYLFQVELRRTALAQLKYDIEKHATAVSTFLYERKTDLIDLTTRRKLAAYYENKALGMSNEYGLEASLFDIGQILRRLQERKRLEGDVVYSRIVFADNEGRLLADSGTATPRAETERDERVYPDSGDPEPSIFSEKADEGWKIVVSVPYLFKEKPEGRITAWIPAEVISRHLLPADGESSQRVIDISYGKDDFPPSAGTVSQSSSPGLSHQSDQFQEIEALGVKGERRRMLSIRLPIEDTPFSLICVVPATEVYGHAAPWNLLMTMGAVAVVLLGGAAFFIRIDARNLVLRTRLEEAVIRERAIEEKNLVLEAEIARRKEVENALREVHEDLEKRISDRTAELSASNEMLRREVAEREQAEAELRLSEQRFRTLVESSPTGILIIKKDRIVYHNPEMERLFGGAASRSSAVDFRGICPEDVEKVRGLYKSLCSGEIRSAELDFRFQGFGKGKERAVALWVNCRASLIGYHGGEAILVNLTDISRLKELEQMLRINDRMTSLGRVATGIAHELRNPLSGLNVFLTNLERTLSQVSGLDSETLQKVTKILSQIKSTSHRIERVVKRVMDFSRPSTPKLALVDLNHSIEAALELSAVTLRKSGITVEKRLEADLPECFADAHLMEQVLLNLITNAVQVMKHKEGPRCLSVSSSLASNHIVIKVCDSGPGVPLDMRGRVFDPFFTTQKNGAGIGLSISHRIVTDHGGSLGVSASRWGGAEFTIEIPIDKRRIV